MQTTAPSKTLIKLVDLAVLPAAILIFTKIISLLIINAVLGLSWDVQTFSDAFFGIKLTYSTYELSTVITYSNLFMHFAALSGASIAIIKLYYLHPAHVRPSVVLKLAKSDRLHYIQSSFHLYHEAIVWTLFMLVTDIIILINFTQGLTESWVLGLSIISTLFFVFILVRTVDRDVFLKNIKYK